MLVKHCTNVIQMFCVYWIFRGKTEESLAIPVFLYFKMTASMVVKCCDKLEYAIIFIEFELTSDFSQYWY